MSKLIRFLPAFGASALLVLLGSGCTQKAKEARALAKANRYYDAGQYDSAEIEYLNVGRIDHQNAVAIGRLGIIYFDEGRLARSFPFLNAAQKLEPDNLELRLKLGLHYLTFGRFQKATDEANFILDKDPRSEDAPLLLAQAAIRPKEMERARQRLLGLPASVQERAPVLVALGSLEFRQHHLGEAESFFKRALAADPNSAAAYTAMGALYWERRDAASAGKAFARAAELSPIRSAKRLQYAQYRIQTGDRDGARRMLEDINQKAPDFLPGSMLLAELDESEKKYDESEAAVAKVLDRDPTFSDAVLLSARLKMAKGEPQKAVAELERVETVFPHYPQIEYELAQAYLAVGANEKAANSLRQVVLWVPDFAEAVMALAQIDIQAGDTGSAIVSLKALIEKRPDLSDARRLLASAYLAQNDYDDALAVYQQLAAASPRDPQPYLLAGMAMLRQDKRDAARIIFERARRVAPDYLPALQQLVTLDLREGRASAALQRVNAQIARSPKEAGAYVLLGRIYLSQKSWPDAEAALRKAIDLQPESPTAYFLAAELYFVTKQDEKALADLKQAVAKNPKDTAALMLMGTIQERQKSYAGARTAYEKVLALDPNFSPALNNLACLYSDNFGMLDKAFEMAQRARQLLPNEPHAADTLGWILYKRHEYPWALSLLQESVDNLPDQADTLFHLGMAQYMLGQESKARSALQHALAISSDFDGAGDARQRLSVLEINPATAGPADHALLESAAASRPDDPIVLSRLAAVYERDGEVDKAIQTCNAALRDNPNNVAALARLARLYSAKGDTARAFELAKSAHSLDADDTGVSDLLGRLAYQTGDHTWAASLLQEAASRQPNDPDVQFDFAKASYSVGRVADAVAAAKAALDLNAAFSRAAEAKRFLEMVRITASPAKEYGADIDQILSKDPNDLPTLSAKAAISELDGDPNASRKLYENLLSHYPNFLPAEKSLVILYAELPAGNPRAIDLGAKAREAFPDDLDVAKACGIIAYRQKDFQRAASLLAESSVKRADDGEVAFYLGMAQIRTKDPAGKATLQHALALNLRPELAAEARDALGGARN